MTRPLIGGGYLRHAELLPRVHCHRTLRHQLHGDLASEAQVDRALDADVGKLLVLELDVLAELVALASQLGVLGVELRTDRDVFHQRPSTLLGPPGRQPSLRPPRPFQARTRPLQPALPRSLGYLKHQIRGI